MVVVFSHSWAGPYLVPLYGKYLSIVLYGRFDDVWHAVCQLCAPHTCSMPSISVDDKDDINGIWLYRLSCLGL